MTLNPWMSRVRIPAIACAVAASLAISVGTSPGAAVDEAGIEPASPPVITGVNPKQATPGEEIKVVIEGKNFTPGVWVSFSTPLAHPVTTRRVSATKLEVTVHLGRKAEPGAISIYVSNPDSVAERADFTIASPPAPTPVPPPQPPSPPSAVKPPKAAAPIIKAVTPSHAARGAQLELKISGEHFAPDAKVTFANSGTRAVETRVSSATEIVASIQTGTDAQPGETSIFVINSDGQEAEARFFLLKDIAKSQPEPAKPVKPPAVTPGESGLQFEVYGATDVSAIMQAQNKPKGKLSLANGKLRFEEAGKEVFLIPVGDVKEVEVNMLFGVFTGTFHVTTKSGQTYNFAAATLRPADGQAMADALKRALK